MKKYLMAFLVSAGIMNLYAQITNYQFDHFPPDEGLTGNTITSILQDRRGFIWFGTENGLHRYDGYQIKPYTNNPYDAHTISNNWITAIFEDTSGIIWVGTRFGLNTFDTEKETFTRYLPDAADSGSISGLDIVGIIEENMNRLWIGTRQNGLNLMDKRTESFIRFLHDPGNDQSINSNLIDGILVDKSGNLWVATDGGGINIFNPKKRMFEKINLDGVLDRALVNLKVTIREKEARITRDPLPAVMCDAGQMERLFQNLIGNAMKYCEKTPEIHIAVEKKTGEWMIGIKDNGIGIDPKYNEKIFGIFQRLHRRDEYSGTGIGLAVCKKIVERHGGNIWVDGKINEGSTFYFSLPSQDDGEVSSQRM